MNAPAPDTWLVRAREAHRADLARDGMPQQRHERWRSMPMRELARAPVAAATPPAAETAFALPGEGVRVAFASTWHGFDVAGAIPAGLVVEPLAQALARGDAALQTRYERRYDGAQHGYTRLNSLHAQHGAHVRVAAPVARPVFLELPAAASAATRFLRHVLVLEARAQATVVLHHAGGSPAASLDNVVVQAVLGEGAALTIVRLQEAGAGAVLLERCEAELGPDATLRTWDLELGAAIARRGRQQAETHLDIAHVARDTTSQTLWRGIADARARGVFVGGIVVAPGADGADAQLSTRNLLLSPHAEIDAKPALEIHADEVKAAHGATVGQLDERALFYLRSRGLPLDAARSLLTFAFCREVLDGIDAPLASALAERLALHLPGRDGGSP
ncbi:MAG TPA: SufD family Fe-S cluster assembly protein [Xanthomonadales bacterium]|nr:SufD family Fe-S cluster assembly protein [Xanthomonadales bacterium]